MVGDLLALASKYQIDGLRSRIVSRIEADWPLCLDEWDRFNRTGIAKLPAGETSLDCCRWDTLLLEPIAAIHLARTLDIPSILPAAFYLLSRIPVDHLWDGCCGAHCKELIRPSRLRGRKIGARWELADGSDFRTLVYGRRRLEKSMESARFTFRMTLFQLASKHIDDEDGLEDETDERNVCSRAADALICLFRLPETAETPLDILEIVKLVEGTARNSDRICLECRAEIAKFCKTRRETIWKNLPRYFDVPNE